MKAGFKKVTVVGAGISGLYVSLRLAKEFDCNVTILEKRSEKEMLDADNRKSINLTLAYRGKKAFSKLGLAECLQSQGQELLNREVHGSHLYIQSYPGVDKNPITSIKRVAIIKTLLDEVNANKKIDLVLDANVHKCAADFSSVSYLKNDVESTIESDFVIGADGSYSKVRSLMLKGRPIDYSQEYLDYSYLEFDLTSADRELLGMTVSSVHVWENFGDLVIGLPNSDGSLTCNYITPQSRDDFHSKFMSFLDSKFLSNQLDVQSSAIQALLHKIRQQVVEPKWNSIVSIKLGKWFLGDRLVLVGDACHSLVHFYAQGMNASLEDCDVLIEELKQKGLCEQAFSSYFEKRKQDTDALAELSKNNFNTLVKKSFKKSYHFQWYRDQITARLINAKSPYELVVNSDTRYSHIEKELKRLKFWNRFLPIGLFTMVATLCFLLFSKVNRSNLSDSKLLA